MADPRSPSGDGVVESVRSLGFRTHLALLRLGDTSVTDAGDCLVVSTPDNPTFWWGNFLLLREAVTPDSADRWVSRFEAELPYADHRAFGLDDPSTSSESLAGLAERGLTVDRSVVLTTRSPARRETRLPAALLRPLEGDSDWDQHVALNRQVYPGSGSPTDVAFVQRKGAAHRRAVEAGAGVWLGAFLGGRLIAQLGVLSAGAGLGRYQDVETHPDFRQQGLAGALVGMGGAMMIDDFGIHTLVLVADPEGEAIRLYRSLGFVDSEYQLGAARAPAQDDPPANP